MEGSLAIETILPYFYLRAFESWYNKNFLYKRKPIDLVFSPSDCMRIFLGFSNFHSIPMKSS